MASPHVAGVAALLRSLYPEKSAAEIKGMILNGADGSVLKDGCLAHGRLDACAAWKLGQTGGDGWGIMKNCGPAIRSGRLCVLYEARRASPLFLLVQQRVELRHDLGNFYLLRADLLAAAAADAG